MHASLYLRAAAKLEFQLEGLYLALSQAFAHAPLARDTFVRLAFEKRQHGLRFQLLERLKIPLPWTPEVMEHMRSNVDRRAIEVIDLQAELARGGSSLDPYVMLRKVAEMEKRFAFLHPNRVAQDADPRVGAVFASMSRQDAEHARLLERVRVQRPAPRARAVGE